MQIDRNLLYSLYMQSVERLADECDNITSISPETLINTVADVLEKNPQLFMANLYKPRIEEPWREVRKTEILELLEKGWLLRRKTWYTSEVICGSKTSVIEVQDLLKDDWVGKPTVTRELMLSKLSFIKAIYYLNDQPSTTSRSIKLPTWPATDYIIVKNDIPVWGDNESVVHIEQSWVESPDWEVWIHTSKK